MDASLRDGEVHVGGDARQRFYDSRGYGRPLEGNAIALAPVEAAHLLYRGDLVTVDDMDFHSFLTAQGPAFGPAFLVYVDLRDRGFYLSPAREGYLPDGIDPEGVAADFVVYPRGNGPWDGEIAHRVAVVGERTPIDAATLEPRVLAVVDEEGEVTYLGVETVDVGGETSFEVDDVATGTLLSDRVLVWDPPAALHEDAFYGQPLSGRGAEYDLLHLSLLEAADLSARGLLELETDGGIEALLERGRAVEGERFDRRLRVYRTLRDRGAVPRTGFKFGADFRVYRTVESASDPGHSEFLVRVRPGDHVFGPRDLALDVRLAHGVRKRMVFALDGANDEQTRWLSIGRLTP